MRTDVAIDYLGNAITSAIDEAFYALIENYDVDEDEATALVDYMADAEYSVDFGDGERRELG